MKYEYYKPAMGVQMLQAQKDLATKLIAPTHYSCTYALIGPMTNLQATS